MTVQLGISMGGAQVTRYTQLHPEQVAAVVGIIPAYDPKAVYETHNVADYYMELAWGFSGVANFPDALDLAPKAPLAHGVPIMSGYAANDDLVPAATVTGYHAAVGGDPDDLINLGNLGHTDAALGAMPVSAIGRFLARHGA